MKVACLVPVDHFHAPLVLSALARLEGVRLLAILTPKIPGKGSILSKMLRLLGESGTGYLSAMAWMKLGFLIHSRAEAWLGRPAEQRRYMSVRDVVEAWEIPSRFVRDVNGPEAEAALGEFSPDLILSIFFNQIIRNRVIRLAPQALNVHPSRLPAYRGVSPAFWILKNGERTGGASVHRLTEEVDGGEILLREEVPVEPGDTIFSLYRRSAAAAAGLLSENLGPLVRGEVGPLPLEGEGPTSFGKITPAAMGEFRRTGRRFCRLLRPL